MVLPARTTAVTGPFATQRFGSMDWADPTIGEHATIAATASTQVPNAERTLMGDSLSSEEDHARCERVLTLREAQEEDSRLEPCAVEGRHVRPGTQRSNLAARHSPARNVEQIQRGWPAIG